MSADQKGKFSFPELDRTLHERARLGILSCLASSQSALTFADLRDLCDLTDGNLSRHLHALEQAGIVELRRGTRGTRPLTLVLFTTDGRRRFLDYVDALEEIVRDSAAAMRGRRKEPRDRRALPEGWVPA